MKTERRHELHTNELSQQIDELVVFSRSHGKQIATWALVIAAVGVGAWWFRSTREAKQVEAWHALFDAETTSADDVRGAISHYRELLGRGMGSMYSAAALLKAAETAERASTDQKRPASERQEFAREADGLCNEVISGYAGEVGLAARARLMRGRLAEDRGEFGEAKKIYEALVADAALAKSPAKSEAEYRLAHMSEWEARIEFPPPLPPTTAPLVTVTPTATTGATTADQIPSPTPPISPSEAPQATTQPAGGS